MGCHQVRRTAQLCRICSTRVLSKVPSAPRGGGRRCHVSECATDPLKIVSERIWFTCSVMNTFSHRSFYTCNTCKSCLMCATPFFLPISMTFGLLLTNTATTVCVYKIKHCRSSTGRLLSVLSKFRSLKRILSCRNWLGPIGPGNHLPAIFGSIFATAVWRFSKPNVKMASYWLFETATI